MGGGGSGGGESGGRALSELLMGFRQALLLAVDVIERYESVKPRTSELRRMWRDGRLDTSQEGESVV